ncbi:MAG TPA: DUF1493 family protein [Flavipsychrobacter sp.]
MQQDKVGCFSRVAGARGLVYFGVVFTIEEIIGFIEKRVCVDNIHPDDDLYKKHHVYGDDWFELIEAYANDFKVDCSNLLWYFHTCEEGRFNSPGKLFFKSPDEMVEYMPVTPAMLLDFANKGKWDIEYPSHEIPKTRKDTMTSQVVISILVVFMLLILLAKAVKKWG